MSSYLRSEAVQTRRMNGGFEERFQALGAREGPQERSV